jgi:ppGpp synthetase/RelA/SpoT-type nucleotidyltranferase
MDAEAARIKYLKERDRYEKLASQVANEISRRMSECHIPCEVSSRAKAVSSFVKKALAKNNYQDPWQEITDKAGVRVVFEHPGDLDKALKEIQEVFPDSTLEDERRKAGTEKELKYPKTHLQVRLQSIHAGSPLDHLECEVQLRTRAQDLWSRMSHALLYKPAVPTTPDVRRSLYRLLALVELYDAEVERGMTTMTESPDFEESQLLHSAESIFHEFVGSDYRLELSQEVIPVLMCVIAQSVKDYSAALMEFADRNRPKLAQFFMEYGPESASGAAGQNFLASQPECIIIFELVARKPESLRAIWNRELPPDWLSEIAESWGVYL